MVAGAGLLLLVLGLLSATRAVAIPMLGQYFYGNVTSVQGATPVTVEARVGGLVFDGIVDSAQHYGYHPNEFLIPADDPETQAKEGAVAGEPIAFYIKSANNTCRAMLQDPATGQWHTTTPFKSGDITQLNLVCQHGQALIPLLVR
jgi:hypothetical protein